MDVAQTKRQAEIDRITGAPVDRIHTEACRVLPTRNDMLDALPKEGVAVEVGVALGNFSEEILERLEPKKLYLIDTWLDDRFAEGLKVVQEKFARHLENGTIELCRGRSTDVLSSFPDGYFDFVYLDTTHAYDLTVRELEMSSAKVNKRGFIAGHDFCAGNVVAPHVYGVIQATGRFCREERWRYKYISIDPDTYFSFCLERLCG